MVECFKNKSRGNMNDTMRPFLDEGLTAYAKARATLTFFEEEIGKLLSATLGRREEWPFSERVKTSRPKGDKSEGQAGYWVTCNIEALTRSKEQVFIECGIWWNAPEGSNPIVFACFHKPENIRRFAGPKQEQGIYSFNYWDKTHLYVPVATTEEIGGALKRVLDELLQQLK